MILKNPSHLQQEWVKIRVTGQITDLPWRVIYKLLTHNPVTTTHNVFGIDFSEVSLVWLLLLLSPPLPPYSQPYHPDSEKRLSWQNKKLHRTFRPYVGSYIAHEWFYINLLTYFSNGGIKLTPESHKFQLDYKNLYVRVTDLDLDVHHWGGEEKKYRFDVPQTKRREE